ncbi:HtaA domain-containing protein [Leucobacter luti]|uniref:HtaA domain-containing protein n=1 Tax=Leucobacter luti TaxID=340320 RepID=UPI003D07BFFE
MGILTATLVALGMMVVMPPAAHADTSDKVSSSTFEWGVKTSFRGYIANPVFKGKTTLLGTVVQKTAGGPFTWSGGSGTGKADGSAANVSFGAGNGVHFQSHPMSAGEGAAYALDMKFTNPRVVIDGPKSAKVHFDVVARKFESMASVGEPFELTNVQMLDLTLPDPVVKGQNVTFASAPAKLTVDGAKAFGGFYPAGEVLDPVTFSMDVARVIPAEKTTVELSVSPASPVVTGTEVVLSAKVAPANAAGAVTFFDGPTAIGEPVAVKDGAAQSTTTSLAAGGHSFKAVFTGAEGFAGSESEATKNFGVVDASEPTVCAPAPNATEYRGVSAQWAYSAYTNAAAHGAEGYQMPKFASGNISVADKDFALKNGVARVSQGCTTVSFTGSMRVEAYQSYFPTHGQWVELIDPVLTLDAQGSGSWSADVRSGTGELNQSAAERVVVATVTGATVPNFAVDTVDARVSLDYAGSVATGTWAEAKDAAWGNAFILKVPSAIRAFYFASDAKSDAQKVPEPIRIQREWAPVGQRVDVSVEGASGATAAQGQKVVFTAGPFKRGSEVTGEVHSAPVSIGKATAGEDGMATFEWTVPSGFEPGKHTAVFTSGAAKVETQITVTEAKPEVVVPVKPEPKPAPTAPSVTDTKKPEPAKSAAKKDNTGSTLAKTGGEELFGAMAVGAVALLAGAVLMLRRRESAHRTTAHRHEGR